MKLVITTALAALLAFPAYAQQKKCAPMGAIADILKERHGEAIVFAGLNGQGNLISVWKNPETGKWTLVATNPKGLGCILSWGDGGETFDAPPVGEEM